MWYWGQQTIGTTPIDSSFGCATSEDGITWTRDPANPVLTYGGELLRVAGPDGAARDHVRGLGGGRRGPEELGGGPDGVLVEGLQQRVLPMPPELAEQARRMLFATDRSLLLDLFALALSPAYGASQTLYAGARLSPTVPADIYRSRDGGETWQRVVAVETVDRYGRLQRHTATEYKVGYRSVSGVSGEWFVAAHLRLEPGDAAAAQRRIRELLNRRGATQPTQQYSCGSVFRNPPGDHAARLIEAAGLTFQEAADLLQVSRASVQTHRRRGMARLRKRLGVTSDA